MARLSPLVRSRRGLATTLAVLAIPVAGCGETESTGKAGADPASLVPTSAPVYAEAVVRPDGDLRSAVERVSQKLLHQDAGAAIVQKLDESLREEGLTYAHDIQPWLGDRVGLAVTGIARDGRSPEMVAILASNDTDAARDALAKAKDTIGREYHDVAYRYDRDDQSAAGVVGDAVVLGDERAFKAAVDAHAGDSLADSDRYKKAHDEVSDSGLGFVYLDPDRAIDLLARASGEAATTQIKTLRQSLLGSGVQSVVASLDVEDDALRVSGAAIGAKAPEGKGDAAGALKKAPADAWLAAGVRDVGATIKQAIAGAGQGAAGGISPEAMLQQLEAQAGIDLQRDFLSWMGDARLFVRGSTPRDLGGALVVDVKDRDAARRGLASLKRLADGFGGGTKALSSGPVDGFALQVGPSAELEIGLAGDELVVAYGRDAARAAVSGSDRLGDSPAYDAAKKALGGDTDPVLFLDTTKVVGLLSGVAGSNAELGKAKATLDALGPLAAGASRDGEVQRFKLGVQVK